MDENMEVGLERILREKQTNARRLQSIKGRSISKSRLSSTSMGRTNVLSITLRVVIKA